MVNMNGTCDFCWANGTWPANDLHVIFEWKISFQSHQFSGCPGFFRAEAARWPSNRCSRLDWGSTPKGVVTNGRKLGRSRRFWRWRWKVRSVAKLTKLKLSLWMRSRSFLRSTTGAVPSQWPWIHKECLYRTCVCIGYSYGYGSKWNSPKLGWLILPRPQQFSPVPMCINFVLAPKTFVIWTNHPSYGWRPITISNPQPEFYDPTSIPSPWISMFDPSKFSSDGGYLKKPSETHPHEIKSMKSKTLPWILWQHLREGTSRIKASCESLLKKGDPWGTSGYFLCALHNYGCIW